MKKMLLMALTASVFFACSKEDANSSQGKGETSYLALSFPTTGKANTSENGTEQESKIAKATVLLFDEKNICLGVTDFGALTASTASSAKEVSSKTKKVFVVVNNPINWSLTVSAVVDKSWDVINTYASVLKADIATDNSFMMTNSGDNTKGALVNVTLYETAGEAENAPTSVYVDRVASKVQVKSTSPTTNNAVFVFTGWDLNTVNKTTRLYSDRITYANASTGAVAGVYRKDKNYYKIDFPTDYTTSTYLKDNYIWLTNGTSSSNMSDIKIANGGFAYCAENTMDADAQLWGHTTKVVVKGQYTPTQDALGAILAAGVSYFSWDGYNYSVDNMKAEYKKTEKASLKTDLIAFLKATDDTFAALTEDQQKEDANIDAAIGNLDNYSGIKAKYNAVKYYHLSVCYYDALIRHDNSVVTSMVLGRYGVVRNNFYEINITKVSGPGTPWIPDPTNPVDPTDPTDPDDDIPANLSVKVEVNPWTRWAHDVELGQ